MILDSNQTSTIANLAIVLRRYGLLGFDQNGERTTSRLSLRDDGAPVVLLQVNSAERVLASIRATRRSGGTFVYSRPRFRSLLRKPRYRILLDHYVFHGPGLVPVWVTQRGEPVLAWLTHGGTQYLLCGLDVVEELVRYSQGDPRKVETATDKTLWGVGHERPAYLFEDNIVRGQEMVPWADRLGFTLAQELSAAAAMPLVAPLPGDSKGAVVLTGDDDQAELSKYERQQQILAGFPITYMLLPHTRHTAETLSRFPAAVEFGIHVDALDAPENYAAICTAQTAAVRRLVGRHVRSVRNHGHLNRGYWSQLEAWEANDIALDFQIRGLDGTCPTGTFLPYRVRRPDGSWSNHFSVFSTFSDSMLTLQRWPEHKQIAVISRLARQFETTLPGIIVANFHPQNVDTIPNVHKALMAIGLRNGWTALGAETLLDWLVAINGLRLTEDGAVLELHPTERCHGVALRWSKRGTEVTQPLPAFSAPIALDGRSRP